MTTNDGTRANRYPDDHEPGTLRPRAVAVLDALARDRYLQLTTASIARKLGERPSQVVELLFDMARLGLIERVDRNWSAPTSCSYRLAMFWPLRKAVAS